MLATPASPRWAFSASTAAAVGTAAAAMVATLPGRTHGLGLVTESLLSELNLGRVPFAALNFGATLIGSAFCLPVGWLIDRVGVRAVLSVVLFSLGIVVVYMTGVTAGSREFSMYVPEVLSGGVWTRRLCRLTCSFSFF
jgi:hypothetical protein